MSKVYGVFVRNEYEREQEGVWVYEDPVSLHGIFDDKKSTLEAIEKATNVLVERLKERGEEINSVENVHEGWFRKIAINHPDPLSMIRNERYKVYSLEYETNQLDTMGL